jgi:hypothetical protein
VFSVSVPLNCAGACVGRCCACVSQLGYGLDGGSMCISVSGEDRIRRERKCTCTHGTEYEGM